MNSLSFLSPSRHGPQLSGPKFSGKKWGYSYREPDTPEGRLRTFCRNKINIPTGYGSLDGADLLGILNSIPAGKYIAFGQLQQFVARLKNVQSDPDFERRLFGWIQQLSQQGMVLLEPYAQDNWISLNDQGRKLIAENKTIEYVEFSFAADKKVGTLITPHTPAPEKAQSPVVLALLQEIERVQSHHRQQSQALTQAQAEQRQEEEQLGALKQTLATCTSDLETHNGTLTEATARLGETSAEVGMARMKRVTLETARDLAAARMNEKTLYLKKLADALLLRQTAFEQLSSATDSILADAKNTRGMLEAAAINRKTLTLLGEVEESARINEAMEKTFAAVSQATAVLHAAVETQNPVGLAEAINQVSQALKAKNLVSVETPQAPRPTAVRFGNRYMHNTWGQQDLMMHMVFYNTGTQGVTGWQIMEKIGQAALVKNKRRVTRLLKKRQESSKTYFSQKEHEFLNFFEKNPVGAMIQLMIRAGRAWFHQSKSLTDVLQNTVLTVEDIVPAYRGSSRQPLPINYGLGQFLALSGLIPQKVLDQAGERREINPNTPIELTPAFLQTLHQMLTPELSAWAEEIFLKPQPEPASKKEEVQPKNNDLETRLKEHHAQTVARQTLAQQELQAELEILATMQANGQETHPLVLSAQGRLVQVRQQLFEKTSREALEALRDIEKNQNSLKMAKKDEEILALGQKLRPPDLEGSLKSLGQEIALDHHTLDTTLDTTIETRSAVAEKIAGMKKQQVSQQAGRFT